MPKTLCPQAFGLLYAAKFLQNLRPGCLYEPSCKSLDCPCVLFWICPGARPGRSVVHCQEGCPGFRRLAMAPSLSNLICRRLLTPSMLSFFIREHWVAETASCSGGFLCIPVCASSCLILCGGVTNVGALNKVEATAQPCLAELWLRALNNLPRPGRPMANALLSLQDFFFCWAFGLLMIASFCSVAFFALFVSCRRFAQYWPLWGCP